MTHINNPTKEQELISLQKDDTGIRISNLLSRLINHSILDT